MGSIACCPTSLSTSFRRVPPGPGSSWHLNTQGCALLCASSLLSVLLVCLQIPGQAANVVVHRGHRADSRDIGHPCSSDSEGRHFAGSLIRGFRQSRHDSSYSTVVQLVFCFVQMELFLRLVLLTGSCCPHYFYCCGVGIEISAAVTMQTAESVAVEEPPT